MHDRDLVSRQRREDRLDRAGQRTSGRAIEDQHGERRQAVEGGALARLGREVVASLLARQPGHDHAAHAHRPSAGQRLGVHPRADDQDGPRRTDVEPARSMLPVGRVLETATGRPTERGDAADAAAGRADRDAGSRSNVADDAGERRLHRIGDVADGHAPAAVPVEDELSPGPPFVAAPRRPDPALAWAWVRGRRDLQLVEARVA